MPKNFQNKSETDKNVMRFPTPQVLDKKKHNSSHEAKKPNYGLRRALAIAAVAIPSVAAGAVADHFIERHQSQPVTPTDYRAENDPVNNAEYKAVESEITALNNGKTVQVFRQPLAVKGGFTHGILVHETTDNNSALTNQGQVEFVTESNYAMFYVNNVSPVVFTSLKAEQWINSGLLTVSPIRSSLVTGSNGKLNEKLFDTASLNNEGKLVVNTSKGEIPVGSIETSPTTLPANPSA